MNIFMMKIISVVLCAMSPKGGLAAEGRYAKKLVEDIFHEYNRDIRPVTNTSEAITVKFDVFLFQILELDEKNQILTAYLWLRQEWTDANLSWNPKKYDGLETIRLPSSKIWLPDIVLYNNADGTFTKNLQTNVILQSEGHIRWDQPAITKTSCRLDVSFFPFDMQSCPFTFGSWTFYTKQLDINPGQTQGNRDDFVPNVEWQVIDMPIKRMVQEFSCCPDDYPVIHILLNLKRKSLFYIFNLLLPCIFISVLAPLTFYLPAESGEKVSLGVTTLLAMTVFQLMVAEKMPPSEALPLIGKYYIITMAMMSLSTAVTIFTQNIHFCGPNPPPVPSWINKLILHHLARFLNIKVSHKSCEVVTPMPLEEYRSKFFGENCNTESGRCGSNQEQYRKPSLVVSTAIPIEEEIPFLTQRQSTGTAGNQNNQQLNEEREAVRQRNGWWPCRNLVNPKGSETLPRVNDSKLRGFNAKCQERGNQAYQRYPCALEYQGRGSWPIMEEGHKETNAQQQGGGGGGCFCEMPSEHSFVSTNYPKYRPRTACVQSLRNDVTSHYNYSPLWSNRPVPMTNSSVPATTINARRKRLVEMNVATKSLDLSDDTEMSGNSRTTCCGRPNEFSFTPIESTGNRSSDTTERNFSRNATPPTSTAAWKIITRGLSKSQPVLGGIQRNEIRETTDNNSLPISESRNTNRQQRARTLSSKRRTSLLRQEERKRSYGVRFEAHGTQTTADSSDDGDKLHNTIADNIEVIAEHFRRQRNVVEIADEWKNVSRVCDRALMWLFVFIQILLSTLVLCKIL